MTMKMLQLAVEKASGWSGEECQVQDYLEIRDGGDADAPLLAMVCGYDPDMYPAIHSTQNHVWMR